MGLTSNGLGFDFELRPLGVRICASGFDLTKGEQYQWNGRLHSTKRFASVVKLARTRTPNFNR